MNPIQSTTTPYGLPWCNMPKNAHKSARELDNAAMNSQTMFLWQMRLYELAMSVFEWENLPEGINERQIEWWLLRDGFCVFLHDEDIALDPIQHVQNNAIGHHVFITSRHHATSAASGHATRSR